MGRYDVQPEQCFHHDPVLGGAQSMQGGDWLLSRCRSDGGFEAVPGAPMPDVLSTATALHALAGLHRSFEREKESILDFVDSLWTGRAFCGNWDDDVVDSEYTYYAMLALGRRHQGAA